MRCRWCVILVSYSPGALSISGAGAGARTWQIILAPLQLLWLVPGSEWDGKHLSAVSCDQWNEFSEIDRCVNWPQKNSWGFQIWKVVTTVILISMECSGQIGVRGIRHDSCKLQQLPLPTKLPELWRPLGSLKKMNDEQSELWFCFKGFYIRIADLNVLNSRIPTC